MCSVWKRAIVLLIILLVSPIRSHSATAPGELITWTATAYWSDGTKADSTWTRQIVVNPLFAERVFYITGDWKNAPPGVHIRWMQLAGKDFYVPCEGWTTNNGQILTRHGGLIKMSRTAGRI